MTLQVEKKLWTADEYNRMAEAGLLDLGRRVELVEGEIYLMSPHGRPHGLVISHLTQLLVGWFGATHYVRVQLPLSLTNLSEPEPDFAVCPKASTLRAPRHPTMADLVIEVSDSSLAFDRETKAGLYAAAGCANYVIVNVPGRCLEVYQQPQAGRYELIRVLRGPQGLDLAGLDRVLTPAEVFAVLDEC